MAALRGIGWCAGLFEGEGTVCIARRKTGKHTTEVGGCTLVLALKMTDKDIVESFQRIMRIGYVSEQKWYAKQGHKTQWRWETRNKKEVELGIRLLYPYMGPRRREKMLLVLCVLEDKLERQRERMAEARTQRFCVRGEDGKYIG